MIVILIACAEPDASATLLDLDIHVDDATGAVLTVSWETETAADASLEFGFDETYGKRVGGATSEDGLEHSVVLAGLSPDATWHWRAVSGARVSADQTFDPEPAPVDVPWLTVGGTYDGLVLVPTMVGTAGYAVLYNGDGQPVWWVQMPPSVVPLTQARLSNDGRAVLVMATFPETGPTVVIARLPIAGGEPTLTLAVDAHHDFYELPTGGYAAIVRDVRQAQGFEVEGDAIVEYTLDGLSSTRWSTWDAGEPQGVAAMPLAASGRKDWTHLNSLVYADNNYWLSSYTYDSLMVVHGATGALVATIGGPDSDVVLTAGEGFGPQHSVLPTDGGFVVFNNRPPGPDSYSEAVEYSLDLRTREYARRWNYDGDRHTAAPLLGNVDPIAEGGHLVAWGSGGRLSILDADHEATWEANASIGVAFGFSHLVAGLSGVP